uniref:General transcription factor 3C polypeptide 1-like n=1 Tax=Hirondellea gigas TaxID=1518452 RepID=A0A6A7FY16_9CRUS
MAESEILQVSQIEDEIALEGLDGITLQGLWLRLEICSKQPSKEPLSVSAKYSVWSIISQDAELRFFLLPTPRPDLIIHNRYELMDPELGIVMEAPLSNTVNIYPFHKAEDEAAGVMGSCQYYYARTDITDEVCDLTLDIFEQSYETGAVVVVASQSLREQSLQIPSHVDWFKPLTLAQYCILERIGRTRTMGDVTQGKHGMTQLGDAKSLFYHRKRLLRLGLITKQTHLQKGISGASQTGSLLHLTRFYIERKSKFVLLIEHCVELLHAMPDSTMPVKNLKDALGLPEPSSRKLLKNPELLKYIEFLNIRHSLLYPDDPRKESHSKNGKEKQVRCARLLEPGLRGSDVFCGREDNVDAEDEDDDEPTAGIMDTSKLLLHRSLLQQAYSIVEKSGASGTTQREIGRKMGQTRLDSRTICRNLERCGAVGSLLRDIGRQRVTHFVARHLLPDSHLTREFKQEKNKLMQLINTAQDTSSPHEQVPNVADLSGLPQAASNKQLKGSESADWTTLSITEDLDCHSININDHTELSSAESSANNSAVETILPDDLIDTDVPRANLDGDEGITNPTLHRTLDSTDNNTECKTHSPLITQLGGSATIQLDESATIIPFSQEHPNAAVNQKPCVEDDDSGRNIINSSAETPEFEIQNSITSVQSVAETTTTHFSTPVKVKGDYKFTSGASNPPSPLASSPVSPRSSQASCYSQGGLLSPSDVGSSQTTNTKDISCLANEPTHITVHIEKSPSEQQMGASQSTDALATEENVNRISDCKNIKRERTAKTTSNLEIEPDLIIPDGPNEQSCSIVSALSDTQLQAAMIDVLNMPESGVVTREEGGSFSEFGFEEHFSGSCLDANVSATADEDSCVIDAADMPKISCITQDTRSLIKKALHGTDLLEFGHVTTRMLRRINIILEMVKRQRVVADVFKLQKTILEYEQDEEHRVDKKSVMRLLQRLRAGGLIKTITVKFTTKMGCKESTLVLHPSVQPDDIYLTSIIEQLKLKFIPAQVKKDRRLPTNNLPSNSNSTSGAITGDVICSETSALAEKTLSSETLSVSVIASDAKQQKQASKQHTNNKKKKLPVVNPTLGRVGPKFKRLQDLHHLLFYLVRDYSGDPNLSQEEAWSKIYQDNPALEPRDPSLPRIYIPELSWRMFIPPIPNHVKEADGWGLMCDVVVCLPLYLFVRIIRCTITPELFTWLKHPIKKFLLIKLLPASIRSLLLDSRRYVHNFMELINQLCYMGLVQLGPHISKERDQRFVYLNRDASILNTTSSGPGYHQITADQDYPLSAYSFDNLASVHQYWYDMMRTCLHTNLGGQRTLQQGQAITIQILAHKPQMMETLEIRQFTEAPERDTGITPGDSKGASGLDSAMFAHLKRNWSFSLHHNSDRTFSHQQLFGSNSETANKQDVVPGGALYYNYLMSTTQQQLPPHTSNRLPGLRKLAVYKTRKGEEVCEEVGVSVLSKQDKKRKKFLAPARVKSKRLTLGGRGKKTSYLRRIKARPKTVRKPYYDDEDKAALRKMDKLRVIWSASEDSLLLLCKVAACYLLPPSPRPRMMPFSLVRNILHRRFPESQNKTGRACQRRITYIMKNTTTAESVSIFIEAVRQDPFILENFPPPGISQNRENMDSIYGSMFTNLVNQLVIKFTSNSSRCHLNLPNSLNKFFEEFEVIPAKSIKPSLTYPDPKTTSDVQFHVIQTLLYSSLCCRADRESYAYQLYQAYSQFSQQMLYNALVALRSSQMISYKKCYTRSANSQTCLPLSASPFQLSMSYIHKFVTKYQYDVYNNCWNLLKRLKHSYYNTYASGKRPEDLVNNSDLAVPLMRDNNNEGGCIAALIEQTSSKRVIMHTFLPDTIIVIDTNRKITSQLPFQNSNITRRVNDLAAASGKTVDMSAISTFSVPNINNEKELSEVNKSKRTDVDNENEPPTKKMKIEAIRQRKSSEQDTQSNCSEDAAESDSNKNLNDTFDANDESLNLENSPAENDGNSRVATLPSCTSSNLVNKRIKELQLGDQGRKRQLSSSSVCFSVSTAKKQKTDDDMVTFAGDDNIIDFDSIDSTDVVDSNYNSTEYTSQYINSLGNHASMPDDDHPSDLQDTDNDTETDTVEPTTSQTNSSKTYHSRTRHVTSASRLSVFMKDKNTTSLLENQEIGAGGPALLQHMQDNLLLTACDVTCQLTIPPSTGLPPPPEPGESCLLTLDQLSQHLIPVDRQQQLQVMEQYKRGEINTNVTLSDVLQQWKEAGYSDQILALVEEIYGFVNYKGVAGATRADIQQWRTSRGGGDCMAVVEEMEVAGLLLREGIAQHTWLTLPNAHHWMVHTQHLSRQERQGLRLQGVYCMKVETSSNEASKDIPDEEDSCDSTRQSVTNDDNSYNASTPDDENNQAADTYDDEDSLGGEEETRMTGAPDAASNLNSGGGNANEGGAGRNNEVSSNTKVCQGKRESGRVRSRLSMVMRKGYCKDREESRKMEKMVHDYQQNDRREQVSISLRPWIRICGSLNRRVLDRMLGTVLFRVLEQPGVSGVKVAEQLAPALLPVHVFELLHMLHDLYCLERSRITILHQPRSFFNKNSMMQVKDDAGPEDEEAVVGYSPTVDCITKLSVFIGDKKYSHDFLSNDRR